MVFVDDKDWQTLAVLMEEVLYFLRNSNQALHEYVSENWQEILYHKRKNETATKESKEITSLLKILHRIEVDNAERRGSVCAKEVGNTFCITKSE